ncbi:SusC/RagA family TonB-linked outer membrane protein [Duncaniella muricolitica]|jgi:TonB-linked SusC/RagA family outer membrane protein|uniref:SusC/RagA family TonB-linked outer membrane protein n=1 Tax=Duncaniella muricolitica TaxID=2880704 RepID=UPI00244DBF1A|nr:SusC/RagA family TonB-linked outer membrane protein [Duncaniella muricolitica]
MKRIVLLLVAAITMSLSLSAQNRTVRGIVFGVYNGTDPLVGATVMGVGTNIGVTTDINGVFDITLPESVKKILVSYVGMKPQEFDITPDKEMVVTLQSDTSLDEVVVTAFGMKRDRKGLGYAVQDLKAEDLNTSGTTSLSSAMQGKLSGVEIRPSSGAPGASSNITIRGVRSFSGNNAPLYVIDGMPVESTPDVVQTANSMVSNASYADRSIDINPDDIESINVLKGQAAAALYGIRATNGVIVITTKRGSGLSSSKPVITVSTDLASERVSRKFKHQDVYAQGMGGVYDPTASMTWGPKISELPNDARYGGNTDNQYTRLYGKHEGMYYNPKRAQAGLDGWTTPQIYDNTGDFFSNGFTENANFSISQRTDRTSYAFGLNNSHQEGVVRNTGLDRWGARGALDWHINNEWKLGFTANYVHTNIRTAPQANSGIVNVVYSAPAEYDLKGIPSSVPGNPSQQISFRSTTFNNPYWWAENNAYTQSTQRFFGNAYVEYRPAINWGDNLDLVIKEQLGIDAYTSRYSNIQEVGSAGNSSGYIENESYTRQIFNNLITANFTAELGADREWTLGLMLGNEVNNDHLTATDYIGSGLAFYGQPTIGNCASFTYGYEAPSQDRTVGLFFNASASWRDMLFFNVTGRNDWVSTMPNGNRSFFYPSVSLAWVFTELEALKGNRVLTFGKLRTSYAEVGQAGTYLNNFAYTPTYGSGFYGFYPVNYPIKGQTSFVPYWKEYDPALKPQTTKNYEVGLDLRFWDDRVKLEYTYSYQDVRDQIFEIPMDGSTGYQSIVSNGGRITTNTHEINASVTAYTSKDFDIDLGLNWTKYESMVKELAPGVDNIMLGGFVEPQVRAYTGYAYPVIFGKSFMRDEATGLMLLDSDGMPMTSGESTVIGKCTPDFNMGWSTNIRYKRFNLSSTWSWQKGGQMYHGTYGTMQMFGATTESTDRDMPLHVSGIDYETGQYVEHDVDRFSWNQIYYDCSESMIVDTDFVKLRDVTLTYQLPRLGVFDISVYGFARNVLVWAKMNDFDPESSVGNNNAGGYFERFSLPNTASFGGGLKLTF